MESNHDGQSQSLLCYHYTTSHKLEHRAGIEPATSCLENRCSTVELPMQSKKNERQPLIHLSGVKNNKGISTPIRPPAMLVNRDATF